MNLSHKGSFGASRKKGKSLTERDFISLAVAWDKSKIVHLSPDFGENQDVSLKKHSLLLSGGCQVKFILL